MSDVPRDGDVTFYWGSTSGSAQKALRQVEEPRVLLSHITKMNRRWDGVESLFADSGGYSMMDGGHAEYPSSLRSYLEWVEAQNADLFVARDYPCEPQCRAVTDGTVHDHQVWTLENTLDCLDAVASGDIAASPVPVVQGWAEHQYLDHVEMYRDHGVFRHVDVVGIGSVCRRDQTDRLRRIIKRVADALPSDVAVHGFGVKLDVLRDPETRQRLTSADSCAWYQRSHSSRHYTPHLSSWLNFVKRYLYYREQLDPLRYGVDRPDAEQTLDVYSGRA